MEEIKFQIDKVKLEIEKQKEKIEKLNKIVEEDKVLEKRDNYIELIESINSHYLIGEDDLEPIVIFDKKIAYKTLLEKVFENIRDIVVTKADIYTEIKIRKTNNKVIAILDRPVSLSDDKKFTFLEVYYKNNTFSFMIDEVKENMEKEYNQLIQTSNEEIKKLKEEKDKNSHRIDHIKDNDFFGLLKGEDLKGIFKMGTLGISNEEKKEEVKKELIDRNIEIDELIFKLKTQEKVYKDVLDSRMIEIDSYKNTFLAIKKELIKNGYKERK